MRIQGQSSKNVITDICIPVPSDIQSIEYTSLMMRETVFIPGGVNQIRICHATH